MLPLEILSSLLKHTLGEGVEIVYDEKECYKRIFINSAIRFGHFRILLLPVYPWRLRQCVE